jgi:hypothetical protein
MNATMKNSINTSPPHITVDPSGATVEIRGRLKSGTGVVLALLGMATLGGLLFVTVSPRSDANPRNAVAVLLSTAVLLAGVAAALTFRLEQLTIGGDEITQSKSLAGIAWARRRMPRAGVDALRIQARGPGGRGLAIIGPQGRLLVGGSLDEADLEWLRDWVAERLR